MLSKAVIEKLYYSLKNPPPFRRWVRLCNRLKGETWDDCWIWLGGKDKDSYGKTTFAGKHWRVPRLMMHWVQGPLPGELVIDHLRCDNPPCANPAHLAITSSRLNTLRSKNTPSAINARKTHCPRGHELSGDNLYKAFLKRGMRACRICTLRQNSESLARRKQDPAYREHFLNLKRINEKKRRERKRVIVYG